MKQPIHRLVELRAKAISTSLTIFVAVLLLGLDRARAQAPEPESAAIEAKAQAMLQQLSLEQKIHAPVGDRSRQICAAGRRCQ